MADEESRLLAIWASHGRLLYRADLRGRAAGGVLTAVWRRANVLSSCLTCDRRRRRHWLPVAHEWSSSCDGSVSGDGELRGIGGGQARRRLQATIRRGGLVDVVLAEPDARR
jgi:hypothetical protein